MADSQKYSSKLAGKRVLVVGGTSGIGFAVAEAALESGATVIISSSNPSRIDTSITRLSQSYPSKKANLTGHKCDLAHEDTLEANLEALFKSATDDAANKLDHIVFTAADPLAVTPLKDLTLDFIRNAGRIRFCVPLLIGKHALTYVNKSRASSITFTTGAVWQSPIKDWATIAGYAAGIVGVARGLALELAPIRCSSVSPGIVDTELWDGTPNKEKVYEGAAAHLLTGVVPSPGDIAESFLYLMKDANVTGTVISTNGGHVFT